MSFDFGGPFPLGRRLRHRKFHSPDQHAKRRAGTAGHRFGFGRGGGAFCIIFFRSSSFFANRMRFCSVVSFGSGMS